jgi:hypothetical protein
MKIKYEAVNGLIFDTEARALAEDDRVMRVTALKKILKKTNAVDGREVHAAACWIFENVDVINTIVKGDTPV